MRRREFIAGLGSTAMARPLAARAQQPKMPLVGLLNGVSFEGPCEVPIAAIRRGLRETGFVEGQNVAIEYRHAGGRYERLPELATELFRRQVAVIIVIGPSTPALAAKAATSTVPIVFAMGSDAIQVGLVNGLGRPQASLTGVNPAATELASKRLELLLDLRPGATLVGYLGNSRLSGPFETDVGSLTAAAKIKGRELVVFDAATEPEVETAFTDMALQRVRLLIVSPDAFLNTRREQIVALAAQSGLPAIYATRGAVVLGGLMSYGVPTDLTNDMYRLAGIYAGRILNGAAPAESPVMLSTRFELVINDRTAKALHITVPRRLLSRADEIID
jgi:ABC-type uncharacterized transport system substrate-binding protein